MDYKNELNPEQYKAVTTKDGPVLILAGAGSGKTRVITYRIAYLIEEFGVNPYNILAITFTNKAANEMRERVEKILGENAVGVFMSTFHRFCGRILRDRAELCGYTSSFVVYDEKDSERIIKECFKELEIDPKRENPAIYRASISKLKNDMVFPDDFAMSMDKTSPFERLLLKVYRLYDKKMLENNAMDFDDMLLNAVKLFKNNPDVCEFYRNRFKYIMVDEYQDTNKVQYNLVRMLSAHGNICVVGDDDQSIYAFRGADINNILSFEKDFPDCVVIKLEQNYRSTKNILAAANSIISGNNGSRKQKKLWTASSGGEKIVRFTGETQLDESRFVAGEILRLVDSGKYDFKDIAVLYRANALSQFLESEFMRRGIPNRIFGGMKFYERVEIKVLINYLRLFDNPRDANAFVNVVNVPKRSVGDKGVQTVLSIAGRENCSPMDVISHIRDYPELSRYAIALDQFSNDFNELYSLLPDIEIPVFVEKVLNHMGLLAFYEVTDKEKNEDRCGNLKEFITVAKDYVASLENDPMLEDSLSGFLQHVSLSTDMDKEDDDTNNTVTMMTVHSSKGLEFPVVFVVAMEEGVFPSSRAVEEGNTDEERRLCYVAVTRAKERLYLSCVKERMLYGQTKFAQPSEFLRDIPKENCKTVNYFGEEISGTPPRTGYSGYPSYGERGDHLTYGDSENQGFGYGYGRRGGSGYGSGYGSGSGYGYGEKSGGYGSKRSDSSSFDSGFFGRSSGSSSKASNNRPEASSTSVKLEEARLGAKAGDKDIKPGDRVAHPKYGEGTVTSIEGEVSGDNDDRICEILFEKYGMKRFAMKYTKLKKL